MRKDTALGLKLVGFVDDDPTKQQMRIHDVPVLGVMADIPRLVREYNIRQVIIAMLTAPGKEIRQIVDICKSAGVETKIIPSIHELLDGRATVNQLRNVDIEDLLRREPVHTDISAVLSMIQGKRVLITGGGGSIGSELCRQIWRCSPAELIVMDNYEAGLFDIHNELRQVAGEGSPLPPVATRQASATNPRLILVIADIRFAMRMHQVFELYRPQIVFHAAAYKHVPFIEMNPVEAVTNNVQGTENVVTAAQAVGVERFVMISTDKAVNPTSIMGASKRGAELVVHRAAEISGRPYVAVRFGNVLGSRGSVIHTFKRQIAAGGPVTVTHPDMMRYFMTIPEAVQLVLQAAVLGSGGETFVLDMGSPVRIADLARDLINLSGLRVGEDIEIAYIGRHPGEKLFEELFVAGETYTRTQHEKIFIAANTSSLISDALNDRLSNLYSAANMGNMAAITEAFVALVPEFQPISRGLVVNAPRDIAYASDITVKEL